MDGASARGGAGMNEAGRVEFAWGNHAALAVPEDSIRERAFRTRDGGAGGFAAGTFAEAAALAGAGAAAFGGAGRAGARRDAAERAAGRAVLALAALAAFLGWGFTRAGFRAGAEARDFADFAGFADLAGFRTAFFLEDAAADVRPAFFPFAAGIAAPFPFLASFLTRCAIYQCVAMKATFFRRVRVRNR